jgi:hypothetical protein
VRKRRDRVTAPANLISLISLFIKYTLCMVTCRTRKTNKDREKMGGVKSVTPIAATVSCLV